MFDPATPQRQPILTQWRSWHGRSLSRRLSQIVALGFMLMGFAEQVYAEDYSGGVGLAMTVVGVHSEERSWGAGAEATLTAMCFNASLEIDQFEEEYRQRDLIGSAYVGFGALNLVMFQIGVDNDGLAGRLHGELAIRTLFTGELGYPSVGRLSLWPRNDVIVSYSLGLNHAGLLVGLGAGVVF